MRRLVLVILMCLALAAPAWAAVDYFTHMDTDQNGKINKKEFAGAVSKSFDKLDKDKNGYLDREEFKATGPGAEKLFDELDTNRDGKISKEEFTHGAMKRFELLDKDKNGFLDRGELVQQEAKKGGVDRNIPLVKPFLNFYF